MNELNDAGVWEQAWRERGERVREKQAKAGILPSRAFDDKADTFNESSFSEEGRRRSQRILGWLEGQGVDFAGLSVLDVGAASGVFTVPMIERGAVVTAVESSPPQVRLLKENAARAGGAALQVAAEPFEEIDVRERGWEGAFDLVFVSMCPVLHDWSAVEKILSCAKEYAYISLPASNGGHSLAEEIWPLVTGQPLHGGLHAEMGFLQHLLYLKGYAYHSLVTRESKLVEMTREEAMTEMKTLLKWRGIAVDEGMERTIADHLEQAYPSGPVSVRQGGRFGKVLVQLGDERMREQAR
ncbi:class I SAM-dependent methyltransferase [Paenibacillus albicereus]|uniref:Class I SAM-dependent methyltransferase n=1 Tax=Paenibacillus albicereus TaxID=2726185 RepID=A0A6H2GWI4_9BACL|nr:methyltransferase domain-containing protein [Paenibacillus albicereus]QJC51498.1 class I SAM-dependent methyltransferase [Paenibacillus albicereus]